ncbi:MAG: homocysteine S-methyltransferase family protein [Clostridia bacterium]|nr:homocysteine S-methyltransferase family protein [Clostridia bacterium]
MKITEFLKDNLVFLDGGMGTLLQQRGLKAGELPERWGIEHPEMIQEIHRSYYAAGSNVVSTNTFGANSLKFSDEELELIVKSAIENVRAAQNVGDQPKWVALDIGPTGKLLKPYGDLDFEDAVSIFSKTVKLGARYGADLVFIETMNDSYETKAAIIAAKESCDLPIFVSNAYGEDGKLMTGADPAAMVAMLEGLGVDAIGVNCSLGPKALAPVVEKYLEYSSIPVLLKPNAGLPRAIDGKTVYDVPPTEFANTVAELIEKGVRIAGGCCGTTPEYIKALTDKASAIKPLDIEKKNYTCISSYTHALFFGDTPVLIGERINPTGKKRFKEALRAGDMDYILKEGIAQEERGVHVLDVNVGLPEIDEPRMLTDAVCELQAITDLPLQIDTSDPIAMERALRRYNGKPMINSVNGKQESLATILPLVKKYGGLVVALTLDESGIPETADGRFEIAKKILEAAEEYGIDKKDIIFDPLALTISADKNSARETLGAITMIRNELGAYTSLGVSNVSFGLPQRDVINSAFFTLALGSGLSAAIMNPYSTEMMKAYHAYLALSGNDDNCAKFIDFASTLPDSTAIAASGAQSTAQTGEQFGSELERAITKGLRDRTAEITGELLSTKDPLDIINGEIIPALNTVGKGFEEKRVFLPQLLMSAEAAKASFEVIKARVPATRSDKCRFVIATVKGDIHDIGKNIVKLLLENYGFEVTDLGKDVSPEDIADKTVELHAELVGLSALMTTTVPAMEETIKLLRKRAAWAKIVVGGAVLTKEYAEAIGADKYAKDAMETVRYAELINSTL